jgi:hypothetical protein
MNCKEHVYWDDDHHWYVTWLCGQSAYGVSDYDLRNIIVNHTCNATRKMENA